MTPAITWFEIPAPDLDAAQAFYEHVLGTRMARQTIDGSLLALFPRDADDATGGCLQSGAQAMAPAEGGTVVYLAAGPTIDAALERAVAAGARVATPRTELPPGLGAYAHIVDPQGNRVGLHAPA